MIVVTAVLDDGRMDGGGDDGDEDFNNIYVPTGFAKYRNGETYQMYLGADHLDVGNLARSAAETRQRWCSSRPSFVIGALTVTAYRDRMRACPRACVRTNRQRKSRLFLPAIPGTASCWRGGVLRLCLWLTLALSSRLALWFARHQNSAAPLASSYSTSPRTAALSRALTRPALYWRTRRSG
jgi:hypothetical protein